jgi:polysaccharide biosynthesis protein PslH
VRLLARRSSSLKVVIVNEGLAYPPKGGNWLRTLNLMLPLAGRHEITYVCRGAQDQAAVETARRFYAERGIRAIITHDHPTENRGPAFALRLGANLLSPLPYSIASHRSAAVRREVRRLYRTEKIDVFQFEALGYADTLAGTDAPTLVMAHNVESLIWQRLHETERQPLKRWFIGRQYAKYERYERRVLQAASRVVAVSREDAALLQSRFGARNAPVVDNGVDVAFFAEGASGRAPDPKRIIFLGSLDWRPNLDSIDLLLDEVMPRVLALEPEARLSIVGRNPPPGLLRRLPSEPAVELHADVPDVRPFLARSAAMAVPLRIGGGSRLKILEAAAASLPVVSTRVGCEGLIFEADRDLRVADDPAHMAAALVECMRDPEGAAAMARRARAVVDAYYDWSRLALQLEQVWQGLAGA